ncbi:MAG: phosphate signaling complex protein PhoU [Phycisphaerales bacterium]
MPEHSTPGGEHHPVTERRILELKSRFLRESTFAVSMLERAVNALWTLDAEAARSVRKSDDQVDAEEVAIEQACHEVLALRAPFARDFRTATFILRANSTIERVGDHATSIAKVVIRLSERCGSTPPRWPTALRELGQRVPTICHQALRTVQDEDADGAKRLITGDQAIDLLEKRLFEETLQVVSDPALGEHGPPVGLLVYRVGRELERVGDLMASIAEDVVYLATGTIIRHEKRRLRQAAQGGQAPS